jgi:hypothetical protein
MQNFIILLTFVCGYETWSFTIRGKHKLRKFEDGVLRRIIWPNRDEMK